MPILIRPPSKDAEPVFLKLLCQEMRSQLPLFLYESYQYPAKEGDDGKGPENGRDSENPQVAEKDFPAEFYHFLNLAAGNRIRFPTKNTFDSLVRKAEIYTYLKRHRQSRDAFKNVMKRYSLTRGDAERIFRNVKELLSRPL